jgi:hypothetical protein
MVPAMDSLVGTGNIYYGQVGYLFAKPINPAKRKTTSLCKGQIADLDALNNPMSLYELGANYLTGTFGPKLSLGYQNRSILKTGIQYPQSDRKSMFLQFQISFK